VSWIGTLMNQDKCNPGGESAAYAVKYGSAKTTFAQIVNNVRVPIAFVTQSSGLVGLSWFAMVLRSVCWVLTEKRVGRDSWAVRLAAPAIPCSQLADRRAVGGGLPLGRGCMVRGGM
jgi:hypothetical protein